jgi:toxin YoeB
VARAGRAAVFQPQFLEDLAYWVREDRKLALRVLELVSATLRDPFAGIAKPELLKHLGPDVWSRRVDARHRLVYVVYRDRVDFLQARYHY